MSEAFIVRRGGSGGGTGATLTVNAPVGATAKITKDDKTKTKTVTANGTAVFAGITGGQWLASISDATHDETTPVPVEVITDYSVTLAFFSATINITYPSGSTCTVSKGSITLTAPDTSGTWACTVPEAGTWTVTATDGTDTATQTVEITTHGQAEVVELSYRYYIFLEGQGAVVPMSCQYSVNGGGSIASDKISTWYSGGGAGGNTGVFATDKINLSNYNAIVFESTCSQYYATTDQKWRRTVGAFPSLDYYGNSSSAVAHKFVPNSSTRQFYSVDISSITGEYYIGTNGIGGGAIYNLWLE